MAAFPTSAFHRQRQGGVTLVEMLVAIAILGILAAIAAPSFQRLIVDTRMSTHANDFLTMVNFTRSEAIKRNTRVTMCKSSDGQNCTRADDWSQGWIVFVDGSAAGTRDGTDAILRVHSALSQNSTMVGDNQVSNYISYIFNGHAKMADNTTLQGGTFTLCPTQRPSKGREIVIDAGPGRPRVKQPSEYANAAYPDCT